MDFDQLVTFLEVVKLGNFSRAGEKVLRSQSAVSAQIRQLEEELGLVAGKLEKISEFFVSPGFCEEKMWLYLATDLSATAQRLEEDEIIEVVRLPLDRALQMITDGEIEDAKTIIGLMLAAPRIGLSAFAPDYPAV